MPASPQVRTPEPTVDAWTDEPRSQTQVRANFRVIRNWAENVDQMRLQFQQLSLTVQAQNQKIQDLSQALNGEVVRNQALLGLMATLQSDMEDLKVMLRQVKQPTPMNQSVQQENDFVTWGASPSNASVEPTRLFGSPEDPMVASGVKASLVGKVSFASPPASPAGESVSLGLGSNKGKEPTHPSAPKGPEEVRTADLPQAFFPRYSEGGDPTSSLNTGTLGNGLNLSFFKGPKLTNYTGNSDPEKWLEQCEAFMEGHDVPPSQFRVCIPKLRLFMEGMAKTWYTATYSGKAVPTWSDFRKALLAEFKGEDKAKVAREKLAKLVQLDTVPKYIAYFRSVRRDIPDLEEKEAYHAFRRGLKPHILMEIKKVEAMAMGQEMELPQLQQYAADMERLLDGTKGKPTLKSPKPAASSGGSSSQEGGSSKGQPPAQGKPAAQSSPTTQGSKQAQGKAKVTCYNCGKSGHTAKECRAPKKEGTGGGPPPKK